MAKQNILVVEDDPAIRRVLAIALENEGYEVTTESTGDGGLAAAQRRRPALVLLDLMLPGMDGLAVCRALRADPSTAKLPIIMVTAKTSELDVVKGLDAGVNDYVTKPFSKAILLARIRAVLRGTETAGPVDVDGLVIDQSAHSATLWGEPLQLTRGEFRLLSLLAGNLHRVFTRAHIIERIQNETKDVTDRTVDVLMVGLRRKLGPWAAHVKTIRGVGYRAE